MAYSTDDDQSNPDNSQQAQQQRLAQSSNPSAPPSTGGGGSGLFGNTPGGGAPTSGQSGGYQSNSSNTGFVNLDKYLNANQDQAASMGQQISGSVDQKAQEAKGQVDDLSKAWNQEVQGQTVSSDPNAVQQAITDATNGNVTNNPTWNQEVQNFQKQATASYNGPTDFTQQAGYGGAASSLNDAETKLGALGNEAGREGLLKDTYQNRSQNGYTQGESVLDNALVQGNQAAQKAMADTRQKWSGLNQALGTATATGNQAAQAAALTDQQTAQAANQALGGFGAGSTAGSGALGAWGQQIANQTKAAQDAYSTANANITNDIKSGNLTSADLTALGLTAGEHTYGLTPDQMLSYLQKGNAPTTATAASIDQYAQAAALQQLINASANPAAAGTLPLNPADSSQAGTAGPAFTYNAGAFQQAADQAHGALNQQAMNLATYDPSAMGYAYSQATGGQQGSVTNLQNDLTAAQWLAANPNAAYPGGLPPSYVQNWQNILNSLNQTIQPVSKAHGGIIKQPSFTSVAKPIPEPGIPKLPKPDRKLPTMPHFDEGGEVGETLGKRINFPGAEQTAPTGGNRAPASDNKQKNPGIWTGIKTALGFSDDEKSYKSGGTVPGTPKVSHDAYKNDTVDAKLTPGEVVIDLDTLHRKDGIGSEARDVADAIQKRNKKEGNE